jgi:hypothetical protein
MIFSRLLSRWTSPAHKDTEEIYARGFDRGFQIGIEMASQLDQEVKRKLRDEAINDALERMNGNHKKVD